MWNKQQNIYSWFLPCGVTEWFDLHYGSNFAVYIFAKIEKGSYRQWLPWKTLPLCCPRHSRYLSLEPPASELSVVVLNFITAQEVNI